MKTLLLALLLATKPVSATVAEILRDPAKLDGKAVAVRAHVKKLTARTGKAGHDYYLIDLADDSAEIKVYGGDKLGAGIKVGDEVTVTGKYAHERKVGDRVYKDEIDASKSLDKAFGVKK